MISNGFHSHPPAIRSTFQFLVRAKWFLVLVIFSLVSVAAATSTQVSDENTDQEYIHIMNLMDRADALRASGRADDAKAKDKEAYGALVIFQKMHPRWNPTSVEYRLHEVTEILQGQPEAEPEEPVSAKPHVSLEAAPSRKGPIRLLDAGSEPRQVLRLHPQAGDKQSMILTMKVSLDMPGGAAAAMPPIPAITVPLDVSIDSVDSNGLITFDAVLGELALGSDTGLPPQAVDQAKKAFSSVKGLSVSMTMSSQGSGRLVSVNAPTDASPDIQKSVGKVQQAISTMQTASPIMALPEEAVGAGAKWEVKTIVSTNGMSVNQTTTYQLASVDGDQISIKKNSDFGMQGMPTTPAATPMPIASLNINGTMSGTVKMDLSKLLPVQANSDVQLALNVGMKGPNNTSMPMAVKMKVNFDLESH